MKKFKVLFLGLSTMLAVSSFAQSGGIPRPSLSIGIDGAVPVGTLGDNQKFGIGGSAKFAFPVAPDFDLTLTGGFISFPGKNFYNQTLNTVPIKVGARIRSATGLFFEPQLGYTNYKVKGANNGTGAFTYAANVGYALGRGVDFGVRYEAFSKNEVTFPMVGARLGYSFGL